MRICNKIFFYLVWIYPNFRIFSIETCHPDLRKNLWYIRGMSLYDIVQKSFIAVGACHWTLCVTVSVIDSCLCRVGVSKFGGERDRGIVCSLSARIQCTRDSADRCVYNVYSVFLISAKILCHVRHIPLLHFTNHRSDQFIRVKTYFYHGHLFLGHKLRIIFI